MKILRNSILITILFVCLLATNTIYLSTQKEENFKSKKDINSIIYDTPKTSSPNDWTILIYLDGDNDLESAAIDDFLEMASVGEDENVNILVQFDRTPDYETEYGYSDEYGDWYDTLRFNITYGLEPYKANAVQDLPEVNMGDSAILEDFISWGLDNSTTNHYALILWDHGAGWPYVCFDETSSDDALDLEEIEDALSNVGFVFDLIAFDACLMGMAEVFYQIREWCDICVASEESIPFEGFPYNTILEDLKNTPSMNPELLGDVMVDNYIESYSSSSWKCETLSCVNMSRMENLSIAIDDLSIALKNGINMYRLQIQQAKESSEYYDNSDYIDLYDFASEIFNRIFNYTIMNATLKVMSNVTAAVLFEAHNSNSPNSHGISIYFPCFSSGVLPYQSLVDFCTTNQWDEFLEAYHNVPFDDKYENNDDFSNAFDLRAYEKTWLSSINGSGVQKNDDYYMIEVSSGDTRLIVDVRFNGAMGDIDIDIYDSDYYPIDYSWSTLNREYIDCAVSSGIYYILVYYDDAGNFYDLWWDGYIPSDSDDDDGDDGTTVFDLTKIPGFNIEFLLSFTFVSILAISIIIQKKRKIL